MQDIIARAMASRNNTSSSKLTDKIDEIDNAYVRATDERDTEEISLVVDSIKQEIVDKGNEVKESLDTNAALKNILPLSEIANYGAEYEHESDSWGSSELVKLTAQTAADEFIFVTEPDDILTIQFWDKNGRQDVFGGGTGSRCFVTVSNSGNQLNVFCSAWGGKSFRYNKDGTYKNTFDGTFVEAGTVLKRYNRDAYTPTADYHPATKKYVDDSLSAVSTTVNDTISALIATDEEFDEAMKG